MALATLTPRSGPVRRRAAAGDLDPLFGEFFYGIGPRLRASATPRSGFVPRVDVSESEEAYTVTAELPGVDQSQVEVVIEEGVLTLKGEKADAHEGTEEAVRRAEANFGSFERRLRFASPVDEEGVKASYKNGVLRVVVPKPPEARPQVRQVPIETS